MDSRRSILLDGQVLAEPPIRWPGGKRFLLAHLLRRIPKSYKGYYEPFLGGGALFFALQPPGAVLGDQNHELMAFMRTVRDSVEPLLRRLQRFRNSEEDYYRIRASKPRTDVGRAARLIYLANLSFNGIYRVNQAGTFNVPYGHRQRPIVHAGRLRISSMALKGAALMAGDFEETLATAGEGDIVYLDPPYTVAHNSNGFIKYNARIFSWDDQKRLASLAKQLANRGAHVFVSNAYHSSIRSLYRGFVSRRIVRASRIAADVERRGEVSEYLFFANGVSRC